TPPTGTRQPPDRPSSAVRAALRSPRAPRPLRVALLLQQRLEDVDLHRQLTDLALRFLQRPLLSGQRPRLQPLPAGSEELLTPGSDPTSRLARLPREQIERLAPQQPEHHLLLAARAPAHLPARLRLAARRAGAQPQSLHPNLPNSRHRDLLGLVGCPDGTGCGGIRCSSGGSGSVRPSLATQSDGQMGQRFSSIPLPEPESGHSRWADRTAGKTRR